MIMKNYNQVDNRPAQYFRAGAGGMIINGAGLTLALERADIPGSWQMAQGGLDRDEEPLAAALREISEETAIPAQSLELLDSYPEPLVYELPPEMRSSRTGRGQAQYWYLFRFTGRDEIINLGEGNEFRSWKWLRFPALAALTPDFRKPLYRRLGRRFQKYIA